MSADLLTAYQALDLEALARQERQRQTQRQREEARAAADDQRADFVLTGSDRSADELEARGQQRLF